MKNYEQKTDKNNITKNMVIPILFSATLLTGIMVCIICNIAISGNLTWSLIPVSSIIFAWLIFFLGIVLRKNKIIASLISLSIFIIPYLFLLGNLIKNKRSIFSWCSYSSAFNYLLMDNNCNFQLYWENKKITCFRNNFFTSHSIYVYYQYNTI